jgi:glycerol-3-phosphate acyltransferase PlsX
MNSQPLGNAQPIPHGALVIAIDAMGGDHGPMVTIPAADSVLAARPDVFFLLHGDSAQIMPLLTKLPRLAARSKLIHSDQWVAMDEKPAQAIRKRGTSMMNAINCVKSKEARAVVSAGNTGALMAISKMVLKMMAADLDRPAIACSWPSVSGFKTVLDVGANVQSDAQQLMEFALMGAAFHRALHAKDRPLVGLLNVGSEDVKGHDGVKEAHRLLREGDFHFDYHGFVEGDDLCLGHVDVVVTDGFTGNIALKTAEGVAKFIKNMLKDAFKSSFLALLGGFLAQSALKAMGKRIDPGAANGGPLLGLNGIVVKSHGGAESYAFANAIKVAISLAASSYEDDIATCLARFSQREKVHPAALDVGCEKETIATVAATGL